MSNFDLGNLTESQNYLGAVDSNNPFDIYKFNLSGTGSFQLTLGGLSNNADLEFLNSKGEVLSSSNASGTNSEEISFDNFIVGADYFARVVQVSGVTKYSLDLNFIEKAKEYNPNSQVDPLTGLQIESGYFTVGQTGKVGVDFVFDGGWYKGELAVFSLEGLDKFEPGSAEFIKEAAKRSLSNSPQGYVVISDATEDAKASGGLGDGNYNDSKYLGIKTFDMKPGDKFGFMLVPNGTVQQVFNDPNIGGAVRPLFSLVTANPNQAFHTGQIADFNGAGSVFVMEDQRVDTGSDKDYNDIIFKVTGATGLAVKLDEVINPAKDWRDSEQGKKFIDSLQPESPIDPTPPVDATPPVDPNPPIDPTPIDPKPPVDPTPPIDPTPIDQTPPVDPTPIDPKPPIDPTPIDPTPIDPKPPIDPTPIDPTPVDPKPPVDPTPIDSTPVDPQPPVDPTPPVNPTPPIDPTPSSDPNQPLIGIIDTGFSGNNPDIDYRRVVLGSDRISNDNNPLLSPGEGNEHGTHILGLIAAIQDNGIGINGINDKAQIWLGRAVGSGGWADSLIEFVDAARASGQRNAVVNLSLDLTQINPDGSVTTRYELTPKERQAIEYARQNHILIVTAAGNDGGVMSVLGQASQEFDNIITVGASNEFDRANYSSYGAGLDILTEGGSLDHPVLSTVKDGVGMMAGTSVAAARATGIASLVWATNPDLSYRQVIDILELTAVDVKTPGWDAETGAGLLNAVAAIELAKKTTPQTYTPFPWVAPFTWDGEGKVTPSDRAASGGNTLATAAVQLDPNFSDSDTVDVNNREKYYEVTIEQPGYLRYTVTRTNGTEWLPSVEWLRTDGKPVSRQFSFAPTGISGGAAGGGGDPNPASITRGIFVDPGTYYLKTSLSYQSPEFWLDPPVQYTTVQNYDLSAAFIPDLPATFSGAAQFKTPDGQRVAELNISSQVNYDPVNPDSAKVQYWLDVSEPGNLTLKIGSSADKIGLLAKKIIGQGDANSEGQILFSSGAIRPDQAQSLQLLNLNKGRYLLEVYPRRGSNNQPFIQPFTINGVFSRLAPNPGEGQVPSNAGAFSKTVTSNGVDTHYYANGYLSVQPSGYATWYTYGAGVPLPTIPGATQPGTSVPPFSTLGLGTPTPVTNVPPDYAGNSFNQARNIGVLNGTQTFQDFLGDADPSDYYRFELNNDSNLNWRVDGLTPGVDFQLYKATNNGIELQWSTNTPAPNFSSDMAGTYPGTPGTYYIRLKPFASGGSNYNFSLSAIPRNTAPENLQFNLTSNSYSVGSTVELNGKVFDRNGANDISRVDFWLKQNGNDWQFFSRNQSLNRDAQWANFSLSVDELATGNYELKATAYDQSGAASNTFTGAFQVTAPFNINASRSFPNGKTLSGDMLAEYNRLVSQGNYLGNPSFVETSDRITYFGTPVRRSFFQQPGQTRGYYSIYQSKYGTFSLGGAIADYYTNTYFNSPNDLNGLFAVDSGLGVPISSVIRQADGSEVAYFEGGMLTNRYGVVTPTYYLKDRFDLVGQGAPNGTELQWKNDYGYWNPSTVGQPTGSVRRINNGWIQEFKTNPSGDIDNIFLLKDGQSVLGGNDSNNIPNGGPYRVQGGFLNAYRSVGGYERQNGGLGFPTMSQLRSDLNGYELYQAFENGFIAKTYDGRTIIRNWQGQDIQPEFNIVAGFRYFEEPVGGTQWRSTFFRWDQSQGNMPPGNFYGNLANRIGVLNLGENRRSDGKNGINQNWGAGSPKVDSRIPNDYFAVRSYTQAKFEAGKTYVARVRADDGFQLSAKRANTDEWVYITPKDQWQQAYGAYKEIHFKVRQTGMYDFHFHHYEEKGNAYIDLSWEVIGGGSPTGGGDPGGIWVNPPENAEQFGNSSAYTTDNPFWPGLAPSSITTSSGVSGRLTDSLGNCTWYAAGRLLELGFNGDVVRQTFSGTGRDAQNWDDIANRQADIIVINGETVDGTQGTPEVQVGDVAQWQRGSNGHVAVVEQVERDQEGKIVSITISESHYVKNGGTLIDERQIQRNNQALANETWSQYATSWPNNFIRFPT